jgi:AraC-like DNA-binding protein
MIYRICSSSSGELLKVPLSHSCSCLQGNRYEEQIAVPEGKVWFRASACPHFSIVRLVLNLEEDSEIMGELEGEVLTMCFMLGGKSSCEEKGLNPVFMGSKANNLLLNIGAARRYYLKDKEPTDCLKIVLKYSYVEMLTSLYPSTMKLIEEAIEQKQRYIAGRVGLITTPEMEQCAKDIDYYSSQGRGYGMYLEAKVRELLSLQITQFENFQQSTGNSMDKNRPKIEAACRLLESYYQSPPSLHELATEVGTCDTVLKSGFKYFYGRTVYGYLIDYRMNKACRLLRNSDLPIGEVAFRVGYEYQSHFATAFKRKYGVTPLVYREQIKKFFLKGDLQ